jgi:hypothetical protein
MPEEPDEVLFIDVEEGPPPHGEGKVPTFKPRDSKPEDFSHKDEKDGT